MVYLTAPGGGTSEGYNAISGQSTVATPGSGPSVNVQTGTATGTLPGGQSYQTATYAPAPPTYDYLAQDGTVVTAYGTAPPYVDASGHINSLYGGDAQSSSVTAAVGNSPSPVANPPASVGGVNCTFCADPVGYLENTTYAGVPLYLLLAGLAVVVLLLLAVL